MTAFDTIRTHILDDSVSRTDAFHEIFQARRDHRITDSEAVTLHREHTVESRARIERDRKLRLDVSIGQVIKPPMRSLSSNFIGGGEAANVERWASAIYFVFAEAASLIKIGVTTNLNTRMASLAAMSPIPLTFLGACIGDVEFERAIHNYYGHLRAHGEWFRDDPKIRENIRILITESPHESIANQVRTA